MELIIIAFLLGGLFGMGLAATIAAARDEEMEQELWEEEDEWDYHEPRMQIDETGEAYLEEK